MLLFTDSFDTYDTSTLEHGRSGWSFSEFDEELAFISIGNQLETNGVCSISAAGMFRASGLGDPINQYSEAYIERFSLGNTNGTIIVGFRFRPNVATNGYGWFSVGTGSNRLWLRFTADMKLELSINFNTVIGTSDLALELGETYVIEVKAVRGISGSAEVRVDGEVAVAVSGINTNSSNYNRINLGMLGHDVSGTDPFCLDYDDVYVLSGIAPFADFLGPTYRLHVQRTASNGSVQELTNLSCTNAFECVQELDENAIAGDGQTQFVSTFNMESLPGTVQEVVGVRHIRLAKLDTFRCEHGTDMLVRIGGINYLKGDVFNHSRDCGFWLDDYILAESPATSAQWTKTEIDAAEFGIRTEP